MAAVVNSAIEVGGLK